MQRLANRKNRFLCASLVSALGLLVTAPLAAADALARLIARAEVYTGKIDTAALRQTCADDLHCAAQRIAATLGEGARLERAASPSSDTIRWAETLPSLGTVKTLADGRRLIALNRFGRKVEPELTRALKLGNREILLDLRANAGGDFGRMLRVAGLLIGPRDGALSLTQRTITETLDLPRLATTARARGITVLVGPATASSAEVLVALLRRYAGAEVLGTRTAGKDYLLRVIPVDQTWRLLVPAERILVPGETLTGGLVPDRALSPTLQAAISP